MNERLKLANIFAVIVLGLYLLTSGIFSALILLVPGFEIDDTAFTLIVYTVAFALPSLAYAFVVRNKWGQPIRETFSLEPLPFGSLLLCLLLGLTIQPLLLFIAYVFSLFFTDLATESLTEMASMPLGLYVLTVGVLPAFFEELTCRGMLLDGYKRTPLWYCLLIPALFFGLLHMNLQQISYAVVAGVFFAYLVKVTGSIYASMAAHFVVNTTQALLAYASVTFSEAANELNAAGSAADTSEGALASSALESAAFAAGASGTAGAASAASVPEELATLGLFALICTALTLMILLILRRKHHFKEKKEAMKASLNGQTVGQSAGAEVKIMYFLLIIMVIMAIVVEVMP